MLTIHNIGYQGQFPSEELEALGWKDQGHLLHREDLEDGRINFLKTGLLYADAITTVSRTYAEEIQTSEFGAGLEDLLTARRDSLRGIVNGVDYGDWNPASDPHLPHPYDAEDLSGKAAMKRALLERFELDTDGPAPTLGIVSRMTGQKGFEVLPDALAVLLKQYAVRLVVLGSGEAKYESYFQWLRDNFPHARRGLLRLQRRARALDRGGQRPVRHAFPLRAVRAEPRCTVCGTERSRSFARTGGLGRHGSRVRPLLGRRDRLHVPGLHLRSLLPGHQAPRWIRS